MAAEAEVTRVEVVADTSAVEGIRLAHLTRQRLCMFTAHRLFTLLRVRRLAQALFSAPRLAQDFMAAAAVDCP